MNPQAETGTTDYQRTAADFYCEALNLINLEEYRSGADPAFLEGILARLALLDAAAPSDVPSMGDAIVWDIRLWIESRMLTRMGM